MAKKITLEANKRDGKAQVTRREEGVPAVLYGHGIDPENVQVNYKEFSKVYSLAGGTSLVMLKLADQERPVIIRDVQFHPLKNTYLHADFYQVRMDEEIHANVPLNFIGESVAVKDMSGILVRNIDEIEVKALPQDLPHDIEVDISSLKTFDDVIRVEHLNLPEGVTPLEESDAVIALVQPPRTEEELEALEEEVTEDVESVEGVEKKEEEGEESEEGEPAEAAEPEKTEE